MKWRVEHVIDAPLERVEQLVNDPATFEHVPRFLKLMEWARVEKLEREGRSLRRVTHYRPNVDPPIAGKALTREMTEFFETMEWDLDRHEGRYVIEPNIPLQYQGYFDGGGLYRLESRGANQTLRVIEGEINFHVKIVGRFCEMFAISKLKAQFSEEATMLNALTRDARAASMNVAS